MEKDDVEVTDENPSVELGERGASVSAEFPAVTLGDAGESAAPKRRLLQGRIHEAWILLPAYAMEIVAGTIALLFTVQNTEWSPVPVALTWLLLFTWVWFYGVAYRYRRRFFRYFSFLTLMVTSMAVAFFCFDRASRQQVWDGAQITLREVELTLAWSGILTLVAAALIAAHVVVLGRGYRERKES